MDSNVRAGVLPALGVAASEWAVGWAAIAGRSLSGAAKVAVTTPTRSARRRAAIPIGLNEGRTRFAT
jgi:hypothetical protein